MDSLTLQKIKDFLAKNDKIGIVIGKNPTVDEMGAGLALYLSLTSEGKSTAVVCPTEPTVEVSSLVGIDRVKTTFDRSSSDLIVSFPDRGDIEKISYTRENGFLNIIVKAAEQGLSFGENDIKFRRAGEIKEVIFAIGAPRLSDLGRFSQVEDLKDTTIVNIDNKDENQGYGDLVLVSSSFSSVSEAMSNIVLSLGLKMDVDIASNLLSGISSATSNFQDPKTSILAFEMAASLMKKGARRIFRDTGKVKTEDVAEQDFSSFFTAQKLKPRQEDRRPQAWPKPKTDEKKGLDSPPDDWLAPKIYKGSTAV